MCGIAGIYAYGKTANPINDEALHRMRDAMASRGPDGSGAWRSEDGRLGLAHRRLSIIDLSDAGTQPMAIRGGALRIVFNGEIYNHRVLRKQLEDEGVRFFSNSDTEVLLHLYAARGSDMVHELRGMYAFSIWDSAKKTIFLARDPFGIKPLYYSDDGETLRFASQVKALLRGGEVDTSPQPAGHVGFFLWGSVPEPYTLFKGIRSLEPGSWLKLEEGGKGQNKIFFRISDELAQASAHQARCSADETFDRLQVSLRDSVRHHMVSDVPVGVFLSAGLDSAMLVALAAASGQENLRTLTLGFAAYRGTKNDETSGAQAIASHFEANHQIKWVARADFEADLAQLFAAMDQPTTDGVNTYFVAKAASQSGLKVALSGLGGDELFGGYPSFKDVPRIAKYCSPFRPAARFGAALREMISPAVSRFMSPKYAGLLEYGASWGGAYLLRRALFMPWELPDILGEQMARDGWGELDTIARLESITKGIENPSLKVSSLEFSWYMRNQLLRDADWAGMAHSLEIRVPLVDTRLLRIVAPLIAGRGQITKLDAARTLSRPLPRSVLSRSKTGFSVPVREWLLQPSAHDNRDRGLRGWARKVYHSCYLTA